MSLGSENHGEACDNQAIKSDIDQLVDSGIATIVAAGNGGRATEIAAPACVSSAISVGASTDQDAIADQFSNRGRLLSLLAPGADIRSTVPGGNYETKSGTSAAAPHVAAAWAIMKEINPNASVRDILGALRSTGFQIEDQATGIRYPRVRLSKAADAVGKIDVSKVKKPPPKPPINPVTFERIERAIVVPTGNDQIATDVVNAMGASAPRGSIVTVERLPGDTPRFSVTAPSSAIKNLESQGFRVMKDSLRAPQ